MTPSTQRGRHGRGRARRQRRDPAGVRDAFQEARWVAWNTVRTVATTAAFACLTRALVLHGRVTADQVAARPSRTAPGATP